MAGAACLHQCDGWGCASGLATLSDLECPPILRKANTDMITDPHIFSDDQHHLTGYLTQPATLNQWRAWLAALGISPDDATIDGHWAIASFINGSQAQAALEAITKACPAP